jgi:hypothetical protein
VVRVHELPVGAAYLQLRRGKYYDFGWLERRLHALNFRLVFCWRAEESFAAAAREERLRVSGNPKQYLDLPRSSRSSA